MQSAVVTHLLDMMALIMIYLLPHVHFHGSRLCICKEMMISLLGQKQRQPIYHPRHISRKTKSEYMVCCDLNVVLCVEPVVKFSLKNKNLPPTLLEKYLK